jgi:hypothetical protein
MSVDFYSMRTRDLRRWLLKMGAEESDVSKILDKKELITLALNILKTQEFEKSYHDNLNKIYYGTIIMGVVIFIYLAKDLLISISSSLISFLMQEFFLVQIKFKILKKAIKHARIFAILTLLISILCDLTINCIQYSIILSWVIPRDNFLRFYLVKTFSIPMSPSNLLGFGSSMYSVDIGPMVTIWALKFLGKKFENIVGEQLIDVADLKNKKRFQNNNNFNSKKSSDNSNLNYVNSNVDISDYSRNSILHDRNDGSEEILQDAYEDGSTIICQKCSSMIKKSRMDQHKEFWCPGINLSQSELEIENHSEDDIKFDHFDQTNIVDD